MMLAVGCSVQSGDVRQWPKSRASDSALCPPLFDLLSEMQCTRALTQAARRSTDAQNIHSYMLCVTKESHV